MHKFHPCHHGHFTYKPTGKGQVILSTHLNNNFLMRSTFGEYSHGTQNILIIFFFPFSSVQFRPSVMSNSLQPYELQHTRPLCPSPSPGAYPNSCPSSQWCHPTISSSVVPFSSCLQSCPTSGSFPTSQFFASGGQSIGAFQLQHQSFQWIFRTDFL